MSKTPDYIYELDAKVYHGHISVTSALQLAYERGKEVGAKKATKTKKP